MKTDFLVSTDPNRDVSLFFMTSLEIEIVVALVSGAKLGWNMAFFSTELSSAL
jgi:hypothetical protein